MTMKGAGSKIDYHQLCSVFDELIEKQIDLANKYEKNNSLAMAYLCRWIVLEKTLKALYGARVKINLKIQLEEWIEYLNSENKQAPNKITNFSVNPISIPAIKSIKKELGKIPQIEKVLSSDGKWRKKRNTIAHGAEEFGQRTTYDEYKIDLGNAIEELRKRLRSKIT